MVVRVVHRSNSIDQAFDHVQFVKHRQLHGNRRPFGWSRWLGRALSTPPKVEDGQQQSICAVDGQQNGCNGVHQRDKKHRITPE